MRTEKYPNGNKKKVIIFLINLGITVVCLKGIVLPIIHKIFVVLMNMMTKKN
ncbi:MAG: hypothetical protein Q2306_00650 [Phytoplasma sp.]|uniref:hypothetical protein n=1 Tax=Phytoplasma sp. TaxID=2155 RepID=UPI002B415EDC|nr:hypothetical protein [Phytoplasma sp.]WRH06839.1 MAG: hypothetical protein Q2306_00650 [Phytoplasma sp.]